MYARGGNTWTPPSTASRAATEVMSLVMRPQWGLTAIDRSKGQTGAIALQAIRQAVSTCVANSLVVCTIFKPGVSSAPMEVIGLSVFGMSEFKGLESWDSVRVERQP